MKKIINHFPVTELITCSGQPFPEQFESIANAGFNCVINLSMPDSDNALENEGAIVSNLGMQYVHIPIPWEAPTLEHYHEFVNAMTEFKELKVWVHCAMNMRASCLIYLYRFKHIGEKKSQAIYPMQNIWQPEGPWRLLVETVIAL